MAEQKHMAMCPYCHKEVPLVIVEEETHRRGNCPDCGRWVKWVPKDISCGDEILFFGKYKGKKIKDMPPDYLQWLIDNAERNLTGRQKANILKFLAQGGGNESA